MKISTKVDIIQKRGEISLKMKENVKEITELLIRSNDTYDDNIKKKIDILEAQNNILSWVLNDILIEKIDE